MYREPDANQSICVYLCGQKKRAHLLFLFLGNGQPSVKELSAPGNLFPRSSVGPFYPPPGYPAVTPYTHYPACHAHPACNVLRNTEPKQTRQKPLKPNQVAPAPVSSNEAQNSSRNTGVESELTENSNNNKTQDIPGKNASIKDLKTPNEALETGEALPNKCLTDQQGANKSELTHAIPKNPKDFKGQRKSPALNRSTSLYETNRPAPKSPDTQTERRKLTQIRAEIVGKPVDDELAFPAKLTGEAESIASERIDTRRPSLKPVMGNADSLTGVCVWEYISNYRASLPKEFGKYYSVTENNFYVEGDNEPKIDYDRLNAFLQQDDEFGIMSKIKPFSERFPDITEKIRSEARQRQVERGHSVGLPPERESRSSDTLRIPKIKPVTSSTKLYSSSAERQILHGYQPGSHITEVTEFTRSESQSDSTPVHGPSRGEISPCELISFGSLSDHGQRVLREPYSNENEKMRTVGPDMLPPQRYLKSNLVKDSLYGKPDVDDNERKTLSNQTKLSDPGVLRVKEKSVRALSYGDLP